MGATSLVNVTACAVGSAAWPTTDIAATATSVAQTVTVIRNQGNRRRFINASCRVGWKSLAQVSAGRTRISVGLVHGQHIDSKRNRDHLTVPLELTPGAITACFRHVGLERHRGATESLRDAVKVFEGMGVHVVA